MHAASPSPAPLSLRTLLTLAWPVVVSRATQVVIGVADGVMVAPLGESALAATTTGGLDFFSFLILPMGIVFIVSSFSSQLHGRGDREGARRYGFYGVLVGLVAGVLAILAVPFIGRLLGLFPFEASVRDAMTGYLQIRVPSVGPAVVMEALANYYGGLGNTRLPMRASLLAMTLTVAGNWILIGGHLGAPALGVAGAAWSNSIATTIAASVLLLVFLRDRPAGAPLVPALRRAELARMLRYGLPSGFNWFFEFQAFNVFVNVIVAGLGTTALAAMMAVLQINGFAFMPGFALASAGAILVGQAIGAGEKDQAPSIVGLTFRTSATWQALVGILYLTVPGPIFEPFVPAGDAGTALRMVGVRLLMLSAAWQLFDSAATTLAESLRAAGDTAFTLWARLALAWLIFVPGSWLTVTHLGGDDRVAVFWLVLYLAMLAGTLAIRFRGGAWRRFELTEPVA